MRRIKTIISKLRKPVNVMGLGWVCLLFFTLNSSLLTLTSCSSDPVSEEPEVKQGTAIAFSGNMMEEEVTRAESTTPLNEKGVTSFRVWAFKNDGPQENPYSTYQMVMPEYRVRYADNSSSATNSSGWDYILIAYPDQTPKYWDWEAKAYRFFAVTGATAVTGNNPATDGTYDSYTASLIADATNEGNTPYYSKLWFSTGNTTDYPTRLFGKPVTLEFIKPLSKVRFIIRSVKNKESDPDPMLEYPDFRPVEGSIFTKGSFSVSYPITGSSLTEESWNTTDYDAITSMTALTEQYEDEDGKRKWYTVLPIRGQGAYRFSLSVNGENRTCTVPEQFMEWQPSYCYTYIFKINESGGVELDMVHAGVINWISGGETIYELYNW